MKTVCRDHLAFWYIVLQPVVLKNASNCAVIALVPNQMILVEKLWVLGPNKALAQVLYPAKGYVPRENSTSGQLITCLVPGGPQVPEELLQTKALETDLKFEVIGNQSKYCLFNHMEYSMSLDDCTINQEFTPYPAPGMISCFDPQAETVTPLPPSPNPDQSTEFLNCQVTKGPVLSSYRSQPVNIASEVLPGASSSVGKLHTRQQMNRNRCTCNFFYASLVTQESRIVGSGPACLCSSAQTQRLLSKLPTESLFITKDHDFKKSDDVKSWYGVYQTQGSKNFSCPRNHVLVSCDARNGIVELNEEMSDCCWTQLPSRNSLIERLLSIYHTDGKRARPAEGRDTESSKGLQNTVPTDRIPPAEAKDKETLHAVAQCKYRKQWRYDPDRWITVSALCHSLQVICRNNEQRVKPKNFQPIMIFYSPTVPEISLPAYLKRIAWFLGCPTACFVLALEYVYRLAHCCPEVEVNDKSVHQIIITCIMVATKLIYDRRFKNTFYARVAGIPVTNLSALEVQLVFLLKFDLHVLPENYNARYQSMLAENEGLHKVVIRSE